MKHHFSGFYRPTPEEFETLWQDCLFALDANVLLNLYRYPEKARDELIQVFVSLAERTWVPFQAALEFQRNRPAVIAEQRKRFREVRNVLKSVRSNLESDLERLQLRKRHSSIDPDGLVRSVNTSIEEFLVQLDVLEKAHGNVQEADPLRAQIDKLLGGRIGDPPESQEDLDAIYSEAEQRYSAAVPPGYLDADKDDGSSSRYSWGGIVYQAQYGDLVLWKQVIRRAKEPEVKSLIFLTDDDKADWWWVVESEGKKKLGPRPELFDEIRREAELEQFYMYSSEQFLTLSRQYLAAEVTEESIEQVKEVARISRLHHHREILAEDETAESSVAEWVANQYLDGRVEQQHPGGFPDITVMTEDPDETIGFEVIYLRNLKVLMRRLRGRIYRASSEIRKGAISRFEFVVVLRDGRDFDRVLQFIDNDRFELPPGVGLIIGVLVPDSSASTGQRFAFLTRRLAKPLDEPPA